MHSPKWMALAASVLLGCGPGALGEAVAPEATSAAEALGDDELALTCRGVPEYGAPLIVDWSGQQRLDLEYRMNQGVAVVAYTCERFEVLDRCSVAGGYRFAGVSRKEDVVKLESSDELGVNLPLSGASLAASLERGSSIDLGLVLIGKKATTVRAVARPMLVGDCDGATHFVQAATVGAFAMDRGTVGKTRAAAEIFSASASGRSDHESQQKSKDGDLQACRSATPDAEAPPGQCQAALRLDLVPIVAELTDVPDGEPTAKADRPRPTLEDEESCPEGMVRKGAKCTRPGPRQGALGCAEGILAECERSCSDGDMEGCFRLAAAHADGDGVKRDRSRAIALYDRACGGGHLRACVKSGRLKAKCGRYQKQSPYACVEPGDHVGAARVLAKACDGGLGQACLEVGMGSEKIAAAAGRTAMSFLERACDLGEGFACSMAGYAYLRGEAGADKDLDRGMNLLRASCDGDELASCMLLVGLYEGDDKTGTPRQPLKLLDLHRGVCRRGHKSFCHNAGEMLTDRKDGIQSNPEEALRYFELACQTPNPVPNSCLRLGRRHAADATSDKALHYFSLACRYGEGCVEAAKVARAQVVPKLKKQCQEGQGRACSQLADELIVRGCILRGGQACVDLERREPERALKLLRQHCIFSDGRDPKKQNCRLYLRRGGKLEK